MFQRLIGLRLFVVFIPLSICFYSDECYFKFTNEWKNKCQLSEWIEWNCTCCGSNVVDLALAKRAKAICCPKDMNTAQDLETCTRYCNVAYASLFDHGLCGSYCTNVTHPSPCYVPTTSGITEATTTIIANSTSTRSTLTTTSSTSTTPTPPITTVTTLSILQTFPATSTTLRQSTLKIASIKTTTLADQQSTKEMTTRTTIASVVWSSNNPSTIFSKLSPQTTTSNHNERKRFCVIGLWKFVVYENDLST